MVWSICGAMAVIVAIFAVRVGQAGVAPHLSERMQRAATVASGLLHVAAVFTLLILPALISAKPRSNLYPIDARPTETPYPALVVKKEIEGTEHWIVTFKDLDIQPIFADTAYEALYGAANALATRLAQGGEIPKPSAVTAEDTVIWPAFIELKDRYEEEETHSSKGMRTLPQ